MTPDTALQGAAAETAHRPSSNPRRIPELDGLRGVAILMVLAWHYIGGQFPNEPGTVANKIREVVGICWSGVDLFFVLSGFLVGGILLDQRDSRSFFSTFYLRRACRIMPLYYAFLVLVGIATCLPWVAATPSFAWSDPTPYWAYFLHIQNFYYAAHGHFGDHFLGVSWSLAVEEQFYLLAPLLIRWCRPKHLPLVLVLLILSATLCRVFAFWFLPNPGVAGYVLLPCRWDSLFLGVLGAWALRQETIANWLPSKRWFLYSCAVLLVGIVTVLRVVKQGNLLYLGMHLLGFSCLAVLYLIAVWDAVLPGRSVLQPLLRFRPLQQVGVVSYSIYLFHVPVAYGLHSVVWGKVPKIHDWPTALTTLAALAITFALAFASWHAFELRFIALGKRFTYR